MWHGLIWDLLLSTYVCMCVKREGRLLVIWYRLISACISANKEMGGVTTTGSLLRTYVYACVICKSLYLQTSERTRGGILSVFHLVQGSLF